MNEITLNIANLIGSPSALTREQGGILYNHIVPYLKDGKKIILDFGNIESLITPFLNVAIGKLYEDFNSTQLNNQLEIKNPPEGTASKFRLVIQNAKKYYADKDAFNRAVKDVINN